MLIVLRGNSGSGKTTTAYALRDSLSDQGHTKNIAVVEQDYIRRKIFQEKEADDNRNIGLIKNIVTYSLDAGCDVILEGILYSKRYGKMLQELASSEPNHHFYYLDVPFDETLKRHTTKPNAHEFGEKEMREWYRHKDLLGFDNELVLPHTLSQQQIIKKIILSTGL